MKLGANLCVAVSGVISFALVVSSVILVERLTNFNFFTFSFWVVVPAGAIFTGAAAASGYYFGSLFFHVRPTWFLLVQVVAAAALAQIAIYYGEYRTLVLDDGTAASTIIGFWDYLDTYLKSMHLRAGHGAHIDTGEVGDFGYWLAALEFLGFIAGGLAIFLILQNYPSCWKCNRYLRKLFRFGQMFPNHDEFANYYDTLFQHPMNSRKFYELMRSNPKIRKPALDTVMIESHLLGCAYCKTQLLTQSVQILGKTKWNDIPKLTRRVRVPDGLDLLPRIKSI